jgi:hypothetical protein
VGGAFIPAPSCRLHNRVHVCSLTHTHHSVQKAPQAPQLRHMNQPYSSTPVSPAAGAFVSCTGCVNTARSFQLLPPQHESPNLQHEGDSPPRLLPCQLFVIYVGELETRSDLSGRVRVVWDVVAFVARASNQGEIKGLRVEKNPRLFF